MVILEEDASDCFFVNSAEVGAKGTGFCNMGAMGLGISVWGGAVGSTLGTMGAMGAIATGSEGVGLFEDQ
jgi:hypothetical protein